MYRYCHKCKKETNQKIKFLPGEKESYYQATCLCKSQVLIAPYQLKEEKEITKE